MAVVENDALMKFKDEAGNVSVVYPVTKWVNVQGSADKDTAIQEVTDGLAAHIAGAGTSHNTEDLDAIRNFGYAAASTDGVAYTVTTDKRHGPTKAGSMLIIIPSKTSTTTMPTLNVDNDGAYRIRRRYSSAAGNTEDGLTNGWLVKGEPIVVLFDGTFWIADLPKPDAADLIGVVPVTNGGTGSDNGSTGLGNLLAAGPMVLSANQYGTELPAAGTPGRIFFKKV